MKTYPVKLGVSDGMPTSLFDPRWREPAVAARVAFTLYCRTEFTAEASSAQFAAARAPLVDSSGSTTRKELTDARTFALTHVHDVEPSFGARRFKGGSFGELHRHYALGNASLNFHAQAVCFGIDDAGRFFLNATVGRFDGPWGNDAVLSVAFFAGPELIGVVAWSKPLDPVGDKRVREVGSDARIKARFDAIDRCEVAFTARHGKDVPVKDAKSEDAKPKLSRARRAVVVKELTRALAVTDAGERDAQIAKLLATVSADDARALVLEANPRADAATLAAAVALAGTA